MPKSTTQSGLCELSHPIDILRFASATAYTDHSIALVFVTHTTGGAVRVPGLRMGVRSDGTTVGYVSNGCVEADIAANAMAAMADRRARQLAYGAGTPAIDMRLPCGGRIELLVVPDPDMGVIDAMIARLGARQAAPMFVCPDGQFGLSEANSPTASGGVHFKAIPKIKVRIVGAGAETVTLARLAIASDMEVFVQSPDAGTVNVVAHYGIQARLLSGLSVADTGQTADDEWTACAVLFHDHEWEAKLLPAMLGGKAFYVGALGSYRAHMKRRETLLSNGVPMAQVDRLHAPIGIIPQLRDASLLAISVLAEITESFRETYGSF
jgi:xanthine dehydrogenase accessory factor